MCVCVFFTSLNVLLVYMTDHLRSTCFKSNKPFYFTNDVFISRTLNMLLTR